MMKPDRKNKIPSAASRAPLPEALTASAASAGESKSHNSSAADTILILDSRIDRPTFSRSFNWVPPEDLYTANWSVDGRITSCPEFTKAHWTQLSWLRQRLKRHHYCEKGSLKWTPDFFAIAVVLLEDIPGFPMKQLSVKQFDLLKCITQNRAAMKDCMKHLNKSQLREAYTRLGLKEHEDIEDFLLKEEKEFYDTFAVSPAVSAEDAAAVSTGNAHLESLLALCGI